MKEKVRRVDLPRSAQTHLASVIGNLAVSHEAQYAVAYACGCCHPPLASSAFACRRSRNHWASGSMSMINAPRSTYAAAEHCELYQNHRAAVKSTRGQLTTESTETPLATRIWLEKSHPRRKPAHFNTVYKRNEGWLRKAEGLISPTAFRVRRAVSVTSVVV